MHYSESTFPASDGITLFQRVWKPDGGSRADILLVHGSFEHSGRYEHVGRYLTARGYAVFAFDLRGHGRSQGERAFISSFEILSRDLEGAVRDLRGREPVKPLFVLAHSAGASVALASLSSGGLAGIRGAVLSAPVLKIGDGIPDALQFFCKIIGVISPRVRLPPMQSALLCRDPRIVSDYMADPLIIREGIYSGTLAAFMNALAKLGANASRVTCPLLMLHGTDDHFADIGAARSFYRRLGSQDKTMKEYEHFYHELFNEPEKERVLADVAAWLDMHN